MTPTQRSLKHLRELGYRAAVVEKWNRFGGPHGIRQDLFGVVDILGIRVNPETGKGETIAVQATSGSAVSARVKKIAEAEATPDIRACGWQFEVHGWRKNSKGRYELRIVDVS